jgi:glycosyltransferase involved in cell wall biosynthesis
LSSTLRKNNICAVIPFYNEEKTINEIIEKVSYYVDFIVCIDDGSTDDSSNKINKNEKVIILKNDMNRGKGFSLKRGFQKSIEYKSELTITLDADLQHPPELIPEFIKKLKLNDIVIGNRLNDLSRMPVQRILSNTITSGLLSIKTKRKIYDSQCGYRGFRTEILNSILPDYNGFEAESEMIVKAANQNLKIDFINIPTVYGSEKSKMRPLQAIKGFIKVLFT